MTDSTIIEAPAPKPKKAKRRKPTRKAAAPKQDGPFAGMTVANCANGCSEKGCVIGTPICSHPNKCGLQAAYQHGDYLKRFNEAKRYLRGKMLDLTHG